MRRVITVALWLCLAKFAQGQCTNPCPFGGGYDGTNCLVGEPPLGGKSFIYARHFYYTPLSSNPATRCPIGHFDGANCQVSKIPDGAKPFIYENRYYYVRACCFPCPFGGDYDGANCSMGEPPPGGKPFIYQRQYYYIPVSSDPATRCPVGTFDGANCHFAKVPDGMTPFIYDGRYYYVRTCCPPCPSGGEYDGANCFVATAPSTPFIFKNNFYYKPVSSDPATRCPIGGWDTANCQVGTNDDDDVPFIFQGMFYLLSACAPEYAWSDETSGGNTYGTLYARTKRKKVRIRWDFTEAGLDRVGKAAGGGPNTSAVQYIKLCRKAGSIGDPCNSSDIVFLTTWRDHYVYHDLTPGQTYRFRVVLKSGGELYLGNPVNIRVK